MHMQILLIYAFAFLPLGLSYPVEQRINKSFSDNGIKWQNSSSCGLWTPKGDAGVIMDDDDDGYYDSFGKPLKNK